MDSRCKKRWRLALGAMTVQAAGAAYPHVEQPTEVMQAVSDFISTDVAAPATEAPTVGR
jgi:hypothetical protein